MASYQLTRVISKTKEGVIDGGLWALDNTRKLLNNVFGTILVGYAGFVLTGAAIDKIDPPAAPTVSAQPILAQQSAEKFNAASAKIDELALKANNNAEAGVSLEGEAKDLIGQLLLDKSLSEKQVMSLSTSFEHKVAKLSDFNFARDGDLTPASFAHRDECFVDRDYNINILSGENGINQRSMAKCLVNSQEASNSGSFGGSLLHGAGTAGFLFGTLGALNVAGAMRKKRKDQKLRATN